MMMCTSFFINFILLLQYAFFYLFCSENSNKTRYDYKTIQKKFLLCLNEVFVVNGKKYYEGVSSDIRFTHAVTNDSFMLKPFHRSKGDIVAIDSVYIDYERSS